MTNDEQFQLIPLPREAEPTLVDEPDWPEPDHATPRLLLTVEQAARRLNVGRSLVYQLMTSGELESVHVGRLRRVPADALATFVANLRREA